MKKSLESLKSSKFEKFENSILHEAHNVRGGFCEPTDKNGDVGTKGLTKDNSSDYNYNSGGGPRDLDTECGKDCAIANLGGGLGNMDEYLMNDSQFILAPISFDVISQDNFVFA